MIASPSQQQPSELLKLSLARITRRLNLLRLEDSLSRVLIVGLPVAAVILLLHRIYLINSPLWVPLLIVLLTVIVGLEWWRRRRANLFEAAIETDRRLGLKEKLSSGVAFADPNLVRRRVSRQQVTVDLSGRHPALRWVYLGRGVMLGIWGRLLPPAYATPSWALQDAGSDLVPALVVDAAEQARQIRLNEAMPWKRGWHLPVIALQVIAFGFLLFWSGKDLRPPEKRAVGVALAVEGKKLEEISKQQKEVAEREEMTEAKKAALEMAKLGKALQDRRMPKKDALLKLDEMGKDLEKLQEKVLQKEGAQEVSNLAKLAEALKEEELANENSQELARSLAQQNMADAQNALDQMMQQLQDGKMTEAQKQQLAKDMEALAKAMEKAGNGKMAEQLKKMAQNLQAGKLSNMKLNAQDLANMMSQMRLSQEQLDALRQMAESLSMSSMKISQSDQECECCEGKGEG